MLIAGTARLQPVRPKVIWLLVRVQVIFSACPSTGADSG